MLFSKENKQRVLRHPFVVIVFLLFFIFLCVSTNKHSFGEAKDGDKISPSICLKLRKRLFCNHVRICHLLVVDEADAKGIFQSGERVERHILLALQYF